MTDTHTPQRSPEEIERDIRATQAEMSRTVEQIEGELSPRNILNALLDKAEDGGIDMRYLLDGARRNPLALGLIAAGGLWLVSDAEARPSALGLKRSGHDAKNTRPDGWHPDHRRYLDHMALCQPEAGEDEQSYRRRRDLSRASYFMIEQGHDEDESAFRKRLDAATESARASWVKVGEGAHRLAEGTRNRTRAASSEVQHLYADNPLLGGLAAAFVGAVTGAMLPATRTEERYAGELGAKALDAASTQAHKVGQAAREQKDGMIDRIDTAVGGQSPGTGFDGMNGEDRGSASYAHSPEEAR